MALLVGPTGNLEDDQPQVTGELSQQTSWPWLGVTPDDSDVLVVVLCS